MSEHAGVKGPFRLEQVVVAAASVTRGFKSCLLLDELQVRPLDLTMLRGKGVLVDAVFALRDRGRAHRPQRPSHGSRPGFQDDTACHESQVVST